MLISFIGSAGVPNRYGGFEAFLEHCCPTIIARGIDVVVTCDASLYNDHRPYFCGVRRIFINISANGVSSVAHDAIAFFHVFNRSDCIVVLGVSGGLWFPLFRLLCCFYGKRLIVNVDGVEWRRTKFSKNKRIFLKLFDWLAQRFAHHVVYDNEGLYAHLTDTAKKKATCIAYPGDHVLRRSDVVKRSRTALTVCRIEPENNLEVLIEGALNSTLLEYTIIGNWKNSDYARSLRDNFISNSRLRLLDPVYDAMVLAEYRENCEYYLHGHSVGGTNPSLVEMIFYDCSLLCYDVDFNRYTAGQTAGYFSTAEDLQRALDGPASRGIDRRSLRSQYTAEVIVDAYLKVIQN